MVEPFDFDVCGWCLIVCLLCAAVLEACYVACYSGFGVHDLLIVAFQ